MPHVQSYMQNLGLKLRVFAFVSVCVSHQTRKGVREGRRSAKVGTVMNTRVKMAGGDTGGMYRVSQSQAE